jgi:integrase
MKVQTVELSPGRTSWMLLDDKYLPIEPIEDYIKTMEGDASPNTVKNYIRHLAIYWNFLDQLGLDWRVVRGPELQKFAYWLQFPKRALFEVTPIAAIEPKRRASSVNTILTAVTSFYVHHIDRGNVSRDLYFDLYEFKYVKRVYKDFLYHITKDYPVKTNKLKLKTNKRPIEILTQAQVQKIINACSSRRDKLLTGGLYESGARIGEMLGIKHEDVDVQNRTINIVAREDNPNGARVKLQQERSLVVSAEWIDLYIEYLSYDLLGICSEFVFVTLSKTVGVPGTPMTYGCATQIFKSLSERVKIHIHPHIFRHTHATELLRSGQSIETVQKRLGHSSIQTTIDTYSHLKAEDFSNQYETFLERNQIRY